MRFDNRIEQPGTIISLSELTWTLRNTALPSLEPAIVTGGIIPAL